MSTKRSYTVPVLLLIILVLTTMIVMVYSKLLLARQNQTTEEGKRLAEQYLMATAFAERLTDGTDRLLKEGALADRLRGKQMLGEASVSGIQAVDVLSEASRRTNGFSREAAFRPISAAMAAINGKLSGITEHEGPLTADEKAVLTSLRDGAGRMTEALQRFHPPTGEAGFRQMAAGSDWVAAAVDAGKALQDSAAKLK